MSVNSLATTGWSACWDRVATLKSTLGQHVRFKQQAAIKVLHAHLSSQETEHFQQEAETIATLAHPSIVRVFDFDVQDGDPLSGDGLCTQRLFATALSQR